MKKIYIAPRTEVVNIQVESMIAVSGGVYKDSVDPSKSEAPFRDFDFDFDEEDIKLW